MKKHQILFWIGIVLLNIGMWCHFHGCIKPLQPSIIIHDSLRVDTIIVKDSINIVKPITKYKYTTRVDTLYIDTPSSKIPIEITSNIYENDTVFTDRGRVGYRAVVSGYRPSLDSLNFNLETFNTNTTETQIVQIPIEKKEKKIGIGLTGGYGYSICSRKFEPYLGIGVYYRLF